MGHDSPHSKVHLGQKVTAKCYEVNKRGDCGGAATANSESVYYSILNSCRSLILRLGMMFMRVHKYWLDYDLAAVALLIIGMVAVELLALIM